ncbi:MAG: hypothetical protein JWL61_4751 [Gemmatimonadetes bacterium]|nr:hypothetical protein [Gemmatimonadota bacterium]
MINIRNTAQLAIAGALAASLAGCSQPPVIEARTVASAPAPDAGTNTLTAAERSAGWRLLFDGTNMNSWRGYKEPNVPSGWSVVDGTIAKASPVEDIVSKEEFSDFDLQIEWKISEAGNSGIFYRGSEEADKIYWTAPEYQLLDDIKAADNKTRLTCAGAAYGLYPSPAGHLKPVGEWNVTRIVAKGAHIEHWLNGFKLLEYEAWSPDWEAKVAASKFAAWPKYGRLKKGHLAMQGDHSGTLAFRSIKIRELN